MPSATNGQVERYIRTLVSELRLYVAENERNLDIFVQPSTYAYNWRPHSSTNLPPFSMTHTWLSPGPVSIDSRTALPTDALTATTPKGLHTNLLAGRASISPKVSYKLHNSQQRSKNVFDKTFGPCLSSISHKWYTSTGYHWLRYLRTEVVTILKNYYPDPMDPFESYKSPRNPHGGCKWYCKHHFNWLCRPSCRNNWTSMALQSTKNFFER